MIARHTTEAARTETRIPRHMSGKTAHDIVKYCHRNWNRQTRVIKGTGRIEMTGMALQMLEGASKAFFSPEHWKDPFYARFPQDSEGRDATEWAAAAAIWYHGAEPARTFVGVMSHGYAC
jgi:hypothetical protein